MTYGLLVHPPTPHPLPTCLTHTHTHTHRSTRPISVKSFQQLWRQIRSAVKNFCGASPPRYSPCPLPPLTTLLPLQDACKLGGNSGSVYFLVTRGPNTVTVITVSAGYLSQVFGKNLSKNTTLPVFFLLHCLSVICTHCLTLSADCQADVQLSVQRRQETPVFIYTWINLHFLLTHTRSPDVCPPDPCFIKKK